MKAVCDMTDLEFIKHWIHTCSSFINPLLYRELQSRGLTKYVDVLHRTEDERLSQAMARMSQDGKYIGDDEIEEISGHIDRIKFCKKQIASINPTNVVELLDWTHKLKYHCQFVNDYFK